MRIRGRVYCTKRSSWEVFRFFTPHAKKSCKKTWAYKASIPAGSTIFFQTNDSINLQIQLKQKGILGSVKSAVVMCRIF